MKHTILEPDYETKFIDTDKYPPSTPFLLRGLAAAIQDSHEEWRPPLSEVIDLLKGLKNPISLVSAGSAYGAGKQIRDGYPGAAALLFGAAINAIGTAPNVELRESIQNARKRLVEAGLVNEPSIQAVLQAANDRAGFDRVGQMLRQEFADGMRASGKYSEEQIASMVPRIVDATHDMRHRAVLGQWVWATRDARDTGGNIVCVSGELRDIDPGETLFLEKPTGEDHYVVGSELLSPLVNAAQIGCAHSIIKRLLPLRG